MMVDLIFGIIFSVVAVLAVYVLIKMYVKKEQKPELPFMIMLYISIILGILFAAYSLNEYFNNDVKQIVPTTYKENIKSV